MRWPEWIDVVLEGGGLELERAVVESRQLRGLLAGDWRARAPEVATLAAGVARRGYRAQEALDAAKRRLWQEPGRVELEALCAEVTRAWDALRLVIDVEDGQDVRMSSAALPPN